MAAAPAPVFKRSIASLVGGVAVAIGVLVLWLLVAETAGYAGTAATVSGIVAALAVGIWVRLADL